MRRDRGMVLIITYKLVKGTLWLVLAATLLVLMRADVSDEILGVADHVRHHSGAWSLALADVLVKASTRRGMWTLVVALLCDGLMTLVEGWALWRGHWWGPWLVVVATGSLVPFELVALARHPHFGRAALLALNIAIVAYLVRKATGERRRAPLERA